LEIARAFCAHAQFFRGETRGVSDFPGKIKSSDDPSRVFPGKLKRPFYRVSLPGFRFRF
jgi:hypothetical protein